MPKPVCIPCQRFFRPVRNGVWLLEGRPIVNGAPAGLAAPEQWAPYKLWMADSWGCQGCGAMIVSGFAREPVWEDYHGPVPPFDFKVNDC